jgi:hypothetical protein
MKKLFGIVVLGLLLVGCATSANYGKIINSWVGSTENKLVSSWGPPLGSYVKDDGSKILTYQQSGSYNLPGVQVIDSMTGFPVNTSGPTVATSCRTRFNISSSGKITSGSWQGNSCIATNPDSKLKLPW